MGLGIYQYLWKMEDKLLITTMAVTMYASMLMCMNSTFAHLGLILAQLAHSKEIEVSLELGECYR